MLELQFILFSYISQFVEGIFFVITQKSLISIKFFLRDIFIYIFSMKNSTGNQFYKFFSAYLKILIYTIFKKYLSHMIGCCYYSSVRKLLLLFYVSRFISPFGALPHFG